MAGTFTWDVTRLESYGPYGLNGRVAVRISWALRGTQADEFGGGAVAQESGVTKVVFSPGDDLIPFDLLTEQNVLDWLWTVVRRGEVEARVQARLNLLVVLPLEELDLPWET